MKGIHIDSNLSDKLKILSFVSIIMVVYLHAFNLATDLQGLTIRAEGVNINTFVQMFISQGLTRIAVPLFFMISGYLYFVKIDAPNMRTFYSKITKRFHSLFIPFVFWSTLTLLFFFLLQSFPVTRPLFSNPNNIVSSFTLADVLKRIFISPMAYQFWFLHDLIIYVVFSPLIYLLIVRTKLVVVAVLLFCWLLNFNLVWINNEGILFFVLGGYFALQKTDVMTRPPDILVIFSACLWVFITLFDAYSHIDKSSWPILPKIMILTGLFATWNIYNILITDKLKTVLLKYAPYTFFIYATHEPALTLCRKLFFKLFGFSSAKALLVYILGPVIIISCALIAGKALKSKTPGLYKIIVGGR